MLGVDQEVIKAATAAVAVPTTQLPEDTAWSMIAAEGGILASVLALAVVFLWRIISKGIEDSRAQNKELLKTHAEAIEDSRAQNKELLKTHADALSKLADAVQRVEGAIRLSDANNQNAIGRLSDTVSNAVARIDRHEAKLDAQNTHLLEHSHRLQVLETGGPRILPR